MAAVKAYFYKLREDMPDICEGVDIPGYMEELRVHFNRTALAALDPDTVLPDGPVFYSDAPRNCHESAKKYEIEDAISDCLRLYDRRGKAKKALAKMIAEKALGSPAFREKLIAYRRVPQSWSEFLEPIDPEDMPTKKEIVEKLVVLGDRDYSTQTNRRGARHPLARITESQHFSDREKLRFVADYFVGEKRKKEAPWAVRIGNRGNYTEINSAAWLAQNNAFVLNTVGDIVRLREHFTATNKLRRGSMEALVGSICQLEPKDLKR